jgi:hypothetical protein
MEKLTLGLTIHNRPRWMIEAVFTSLANFPGNQPDKLIIVFDRAKPEIIQGAEEELDGLGLNVETFSIEGPPWNMRCPSKPWNFLIEKIQTPLFAMMSSDCIMLPPAVTLTKIIHETFQGDVVSFAKAVHVGPGYMRDFYATRGGGHRQPEYTTDRTYSDHLTMTPRQHFWAMKTDVIRKVGGFDEIFNEGIAYEDTDLSFRLWNAGCDFVLCDDIQAFHLEHPREHLTDGRSEINRRIFMDRYGHEDSFAYKPPVVTGRCDGWSVMTRPERKELRARELAKAKQSKWWCP